MINLPADLLNYLQSEEQRAFDPGLMEQRKIALDFYNGLPFGDEVDGRSQLVTRDVAEVIDYMTVAIMRTMVSDKVVEFEANGPDQVDFARKATELVAWQFLRQQSGYQITRDALMAGLLEKTGVIKTWAEQPMTSVRAIATAAQIDADETIVAAEPLEDQFDADPVSGEVVPVFEVVRQVPGPTTYHDAAVPNEEFGFSPEARTLDEAPYIVHKARTAVLDLIGSEATEDDARTLWDESLTSQQLADARDKDRSYKDSDDRGFGLHRTLYVTEEYARWDWNGDGVAELIKVRRVGTKGLSVEPVDEQPFVIWSPFPMAHRIVGMSLADKTMDIQRIRSVLLRQAMDALYFANAPRIAIDTANMDVNTLDDVLSIVPGAPIRFKGTPPTPMTMPFAAPHAFTALEFMTGERESRTGITRHNQGLNPDTLNKTASGMAMLQQQGAQIEEYVARNFGEFMAELFEKKLRLMRKNGMSAQVKVGGAFEDVDAAQMPEAMGVGVRVGLGTGRKDDRIQKRLTLLEQQKEGLAVGSPLVDEEKTFANIDGLVADMGLGDGSMFFVDPRRAEPQQKDPRTPEQIEAEGKVQVEQQRQQQSHEKAMFDAETNRLKMEAQAQIDRERASFEAQLARDKADFEADMARERAAFDMMMARESAMTDAASIPANRPGGRLDA